jgi:hypothetical protein
MQRLQVCREAHMNRAARNEKTLAETPPETNFVSDHDWLARQTSTLIPWWSRDDRTRTALAFNEEQCFEVPLVAPWTKLQCFAPDPAPKYAFTVQHSVYTCKSYAPATHKLLVTQETSPK